LNPRRSGSEFCPQKNGGRFTGRRFA